jgi:hypothetical protein
VSEKCIASKRNEIVEKKKKMLLIICLALGLFKFAQF